MTIVNYDTPSSFSLSKGIYTASFPLLPRKAYKVGVDFNRQKRCIDEWKVISLPSQLSYDSIDELAELVGEDPGGKPDGDIETEVCNGEIVELVIGFPLCLRFIHGIPPSASFLDGIGIISKIKKTILYVVEFTACFQHFHPKPLQIFLVTPYPNLPMVYLLSFPHNVP